MAYRRRRRSFRRRGFRRRGLRSRLTARVRRKSRRIGWRR